MGTVRTYVIGMVILLYKYLLVYISSGGKTVIRVECVETGSRRIFDGT